MQPRLDPGLRVVRNCRLQIATALGHCLIPFHPSVGRWILTGVHAAWRKRPTNRRAGERVREWTGASFREPGCHGPAGTGPKALWLCVTDFRQFCRFEKRVLGGSRDTKERDPAAGRWPMIGRVWLKIEPELEEISAQRRKWRQQRGLRCAENLENASSSQGEQVACLGLWGRDSRATVGSFGSHAVRFRALIALGKVPSHFNSRCVRVTCPIPVATLRAPGWLHSWRWLYVAERVPMEDGLERFKDEDSAGRDRFGRARWRSWDQLVGALTAWCWPKVMTRDAEDVAREIAMRAMATYDGPAVWADLWRWALGVGKNLVPDYWRRSGPRSALLGEGAGSVAEAEQSWVMTEEEFDRRVKILGGGAHECRVGDPEASCAPYPQQCGDSEVARSVRARRQACAGVSEEEVGVVADKPARDFRAQRLIWCPPALVGTSRWQSPATGLPNSTMASRCNPLRSSIFSTTSLFSCVSCALPSPCWRRSPSGVDWSRPPILPATAPVGTQ